MISGTNTNCLTDEILLLKRPLASPKNGAFFLEKIMQNLSIYYPFLWALCAALAALAAVLIDIKIEDYGLIVSKRSRFLKEKL